MKKHIIIIAMALISSYAMGQVDYNKKTDRFCLNSTLRYRNGKEINKDIIEMFKYAGNQEGKRWWTGYYVPKQEFPDKDASEEVKKASNMYAFMELVNREMGRDYRNYRELYRFSVDEPEAFWDILFRYLHIVHSAGCCPAYHSLVHSFTHYFTS